MITRRLFSTKPKTLGKPQAPAKPQASRTVTRTVPYFTKGSWDLSDSPELTPSVTGKPASGTVPKNWRKLDLPMWKKHMFALKEKFPEGYKPIKRLSPDKIEEVRSLKTSFPELSNDDLAMRFKISAESIRHILKSQWRASKKESRKIDSRWKRRGSRINDSR